MAPLPAAADPVTATSVQKNLDHLSTLTAAALVLFMQGGFLLVEAGLVRSKNAVNVAQKNIADLVVAITLYGAVGFMLMFGASWGGLFGLQSDLFMFDQLDDWTFTFFVFQAMFCGTVATIMSGAVAERMKFSGYLIATAVIAALIYPVIGHWAWGNILVPGNSAFLADLGFVDFAGSTVVHSAGAWVALAGCIVLGPRIGRYDREGRPIPIHGHSPVLATLGAVILWVGWIGFNGGSTTAGTSAMASIIVNTVVAGAVGGVASMLLGRMVDGCYRPDRSVNGILGGLVAVTAGCAVVSTHGAVVLGVAGGVVQLYAGRILERNFRVDDAVGAVGVHGVAGAAGTILLALLMPAETLAAGGRLEQLLVQGLGVVVAFAWAFGIGYAMFLAIDRLMDGGLRVSRESELIGLNQTEHGATLGTGVLLDEMLRLGRGGADLSVRMEEHGSDEAGELGFAFNRVIENIVVVVGELGREIAALEEVARAVADEGGDLLRQAAATSESASLSGERASEAAQTASTIAETLGGLEAKTAAIFAEVEHLRISIDEATSNAETVREAVGTIGATAGTTRSVVEDARAKADEAAVSVDRLSGALDGIESVLGTIGEIARQTNLIALNATIEAARAGAAGRGFAVVASTVRDLADQTARAVNEINGTIARLQEEASASVLVMSDISEITKRMGDAVADIANDVERQASATGEIAGRMDSARSRTAAVVDGISAMTEVMEGATRKGEESAASAAEAADAMDAVRRSAATSRAAAEVVSGTSRTLMQVVQRLAAIIEALGARMEERRPDPAADAPEAPSVPVRALAGTQAG